MSESTDWSEIEAIVREAETGDAVVGVTLVAPDGGRFTHRGDRKFRAASTVKVPLMVEIYRQIDRGRRGLDDRYALRAGDKTRGSGVLQHLHDGLTLTLNDLIYLMISISDNTATNILIDMAGFTAVNEVMRELGMTNSNLSRAMKGRPLLPDEAENWATPADYAAVIGAILDGRAASAWACEQMRGMLEKQTCDRRIARYLPESDEIRWGSKTGSLTGVTNDAGYISTANGTLIVSVYCEALPDGHVAEQVIGDISRAAMRTTGIVAPLETS